MIVKFMCFGNNHSNYNIYIYIYTHTHTYILMCFKVVIEDQVEVPN